MTYTEERDSAAKYFQYEVYVSDVDSGAQAFKSGADWQRARAKKLVEALRYLSKVHMPMKAVEGKDFAALALKHNCEYAEQALKEYGDDDAKYPLTTRGK